MQKIEKKTFIQVLLGFVLLFSILVIAAGTANELKLRKLRNSGVVVEGTVVASGELGKTRGIKTHYLKVSFKNENREEIIKDFPVDQDDFLHATQSGKIPITYVPGKSSLSRVGTYYGYKRSPLYAAIVSFLVSSAVIIITQLYAGHVKKSKNQNVDIKIEYGEQRSSP